MKGKITKSNPIIKEFLFNKCPSCRGQELLTLDTDTICLSCSWDSSLMDVSSGNFEKRLSISQSSKPETKAIRSKTKLLHFSNNEFSRTELNQTLSRAANE